MLVIDLRRVALFAALPSAEMAAVAASARLGGYWHGARLFQTGDACPNVIVVLDGFVRVARPAPGGAEVTTGIVAAGGFVAVAALRGRVAHDDSAEALGRVRTIEIPAATFLDLACRSPRLFAQVARCLAARTAAVYADAAIEAEGRMRSRVLHTLRRLATPGRAGGDAGAAAGAMRPLAVRLSHAEVARLVGADRSTVTRTLHRLGGRGLIERERGHVTAVKVGAAAAPEARRGEANAAAIPA